ncbi:MAG: hypothetical protein II842_08495 [Butyrivibrio sp.]|nr:hypothetical protein [Butyrivibrio sp.]
MDRDEKIKVAITAGIAGVILLILILYLALSGIKKPSNDNNAPDNEITSVSGDSSSFDDSNADNTDSSNDADNKSEDNKSDNAAGDASKTDSDLASTGSTSSKTSVKKKTVSGNSLYRTESAEVRNVYKGLAIDIDAQMSEMASYWNEGNMNAVRDLAGLDRFEAMSYKLNGTKDFLYFGDVDGTGLPNGKGLACYANDQYYYGEWSEGVRSGQGTWISFYPVYDQNVVIEHMYTGQWQNDLPNGEGQEHYDYDQNYMNDSDIYVQNAIGNFADGLYNGRMYMITVNNNYETKEWYGDCENGTWKQVVNTSKDPEGRSAVMDEKDNTENHIWMVQEKMKDNGIHGIVTGGNMVKK